MSVALLVFIFSLFLPTQFGKHFFLNFSYLSGIRIDYLAPTIYFIDILSLPLILVVLSKYIHQLGHIRMWILKNKLIVSSVIILVAFNFIFSLSKPIWLYNFVRLIQFAFLFLFFREYGNKKNIYSSVVWGLFLGACLELVLSLLQLSLRHSLQGGWYYLGERYFTIFTPGIAKAYFMGKEFLRPYGTFSHPNSLGGFYLLVYAFILTQKKINNITLKRALLFLTSALVLISFSRTAIAVYALINLLYFLRNGVSCKTCFLAKITVAFFLILFTLGISGDLNSFQKRTDFFEKSLSIIAQKPFSGTGMGAYLIAQHNYPQKFSTFFEQPVHNIFLLAVAQLGIPLMFIFIVLIIKSFKACIRHIHIILPLLVVLLTGSVDHYWITLQQNVLVLAIIFGILMKYEKKAS